MLAPLNPEQCRRLLVVVPNWVGDVVLASPVLAALRRHFRTTRITFLMRPYVAEITRGCDWSDDELYWPVRRASVPAQSNGKSGANVGMRGLIAEIRGRSFDAALLLTNSFKSALVAWLGRAARRIGFARDGRSLLLTDRLRPLKRHWRFVPKPVLDSYIDLAAAVGCKVGDRRLTLGISAEQEDAGGALKRHYGLDDGRPYVVINAGAAFGASKCWLPARFAEICDRASREWNARPVLVGAKGEAELMRAIASTCRGDVTCCDDPPTSLGSLKPLIRDAALLICNDTGPRHYGNAFGVPTVTIFGPTHQEWTDTGYENEIKLQKRVECGPCQLRVCPLDHRCMTEMTVDDVWDAAKRLVASHGANPGRSSRLAHVAGAAVGG